MQGAGPSAVKTVSPAALCRLALFSVGAVLLFGSALWPAQTPEKPWKERLQGELQARTAKIIPRKLKTRGKPKVARWEDVDQKLAEVFSLLDLGPLLRELQPDLVSRRASTDQLRAEIDEMLARYSVSYGQLFLLEEPSTLFPLTNNVLRFSGENSLADLEIFDKTGFSLGRYAGKYVFEKSGGLVSGSSRYRLTYFQYRDNEGSIRPTETTNLLDSFNVRWQEIQNKPGLVLTTEILLR